ncbi:MAG: ISL3 family transposase, partial [Chroococcidiopsidaceae cyanobacterium CP_BM_ER_R8_30]|nr:ISL3 family transposase [Chroococcidiopsidaceae cyanobacterium CP_BM_ER_R8_30]
MEILRHLLPDTQQIQLEKWSLDTANTHLHATVSSTQKIAQCPVCRGFSHRVHSHYERTLQDLGLAQYSLTLQLQVRKFFCLNSACTRRIFTERLAEVAAPWARKTIRLVQRLQAIGLALGGAAGERLTHQIGARVCGSTLLNHLKKLSLPQIEVPKVLGVDDFSFRKGREYGTILVDLEQHQPVALLADRKAETLADWLAQHPGVEVLARDRSTAYRSGMIQGAPKALQVADRFQGVQNLSETLEKVFSSYGTELKAIEQQQRQVWAVPETVVVAAKPTATVSAQAQTQAGDQRRRKQQQESRKLHDQHWSQIAIAQEVGVSVATVHRLLTLPQLPQTPPRRKSFGRSVLDPYKQVFLEWWNGGIKQP